MRSRGSYKFNVLLTVSLRENVGSALRTKISKKSTMQKHHQRFPFCLLLEFWSWFIWPCDELPTCPRCTSGLGSSFYRNLSVRKTWQYSIDGWKMNLIFIILIFLSSIKASKVTCFVQQNDIQLCTIKKKKLKSSPLRSTGLIHYQNYDHCSFSHWTLLNPITHMISR